MKFCFDADLKGADGTSLPVYCEVLPAHVGGQKSNINLSIPSQFVTLKPPENPCMLSGKCGSSTITMSGIHWRSFPGSSKSQHGLEPIELLHIEKLTIESPSRSTEREARFHLAPISYLRSASSFISFGDKSQREEIFKLNLPKLGTVELITEWVNIHHRDSEIPGATVHAGFSALMALQPGTPFSIDEAVAQLKTSLQVLSILFRQAVSLHGWTYTDGQTVSTWINPLDPISTTSAREHRGKYVAAPQAFLDWASKLTHAYVNSDEKTRSLVRHISLAVNPYVKSKTADHFLFMFAALERVIEFSWKTDQTPSSPAHTTSAVISHLENLQKAVISENGENAGEIAARLKGLVGVVNRPSVREKFDAFLRVYPPMNQYCSDLWPILNTGKNRGLKNVRDAIAHGTSSFVSVDVVAVAEWHLAILLERVVFVLLDMEVPAGIEPHTFLLRNSSKGWYERDWWEPLQSKPDYPI